MNDLPHFFTKFSKFGINYRFHISYKKIENEVLRKGKIIMLKAVNIKWDTDGDMDVLNDLPTELILPEWLEEESDSDDPYLEEISDWFR